MKLKRILPILFIVLSTIALLSTFIGLFCTVWGIELVIVPILWKIVVTLLLPIAVLLLLSFFLNA